MIPFSLAALLSLYIFGVSGMRGISPSGKSGEDFARERGLLADESSPEGEPPVETPPGEGDR